MQAHQKDEYIESILTSKLLDVVKSIKGQFFANLYPQEISIAAKLLYLSLTSLSSKRTLGEEYVDLIYVNRRGNGLVKKYKRLIFVLSYSIVPYLLSRVFKRVFKNYIEHTDDTKETPFLKKYLANVSFKDFLNNILSLNLILFYFQGRYYNISKRLFGLRYAIGHKVDQNERQFRETSSKSYRILGGILLLQSISKVIPIFANMIKSYTKPLDDGTVTTSNNEISGVPLDSSIRHVDLSDPAQMPFINESSRKCILCLTEMKDPSCAPCGHIFCWNCIINWCKERSECPLCRQKCLKQSILPLR